MFKFSASRFSDSEVQDVLFRGSEMSDDNSPDTTTFSGNSRSESDPVLDSSSATTSFFDSNDASRDGLFLSDSANLMITPTILPASISSTPILILSSSTTSLEPSWTPALTTPSYARTPLPTPASSTPSPRPAQPSASPTPAETIPLPTPASSTLFPTPAETNSLESSGSRVQDSSPSGNQISDDGPFHSIPISSSTSDPFILDNSAISSSNDGSFSADPSEIPSESVEDAPITNSDPSSGSFSRDSRFLVANAAELSSSVGASDSSGSDPVNLNPTADLQYRRLRYAAATSSSLTDEFTCDEGFYEQWNSIGLVCGGEGIDIKSAVSAASCAIYTGAVGGAADSTCISICSFPSCEDGKWVYGSDNGLASSVYNNVQLSDFMSPAMKSHLSAQTGGGSEFMSTRL